MNELKRSKMKPQLEITRFEARQVLGVKEHIVEPGKITLVQGGNAKGKSSILKAMESMIRGGNLATIRNLDAKDDEPSELVMVLKGEDGEYKLRKTEKLLDVRRRVGDTAAFEKIPEAPQQFLNSLFDGTLVNPLKFCRVDDKNRVKILLEALDLDYSREQLFESIGLKYEDFDAVPDGLHPLVEIEQHRKHIFDRRTGINRDEKSAAAAADELRREIPAEIPDDIDVTEKQEQLDALREEIATKREEAKAKLEAKKVAAQKDTEDKEAEFVTELDLFKMNCRIKLTEEIEKIKGEHREKHSEIEKQIAELKKKQEELSRNTSDLIKKAEDAVKFSIETFIEGNASDIEAVRKSRDAKIEHANVAYLQTLDALSTAEESTIELSNEITAAREAAKTAIAHRALKAQADKQAAKAQSLKGQSDCLTLAIQALDNFRASLVETLPIQGVDITDNKFTVDGVPWDFVNSAKQYDIAMKVACLRLSEKFRPVFCDGIEALDPENFEEFVRTLKRYNAQAFIAGVTNGDLKVTVLED